MYVLVRPKNDASLRGYSESRATVPYGVRAATMASSEHAPPASIRPYKDQDVIPAYLHHGSEHTRLRLTHATSTPFRPKRQGATCWLQTVAAAVNKTRPHPRASSSNQ